MSRPGLLALAALLAALPRAALGQALAPLPLRQGDVTVDVRATTVNDFAVQGPVARAEFHGTDLANVTGFLEVRIADLHTGIGLRDRHMRRALNADSASVVRFDLVGVDAAGGTGDSIAVVFQGRLALHGVTRTLRIPGTLVHRADSIVVQVSRFPLDMREYGITPPSRFFGAVRVQPDVHITVRLIFAR